MAWSVEPGSVPAKPTPAVTSDQAIAALRQRLQRLENGSARDLQGSMADYSRALQDLLTTMRVEVLAVTATSRDAWIASADTIESDLVQLKASQGDEIVTAFRAHRPRVTRLLDQFRVLVPANKS
jgi:hypothetical protein